MASNPNWLNPVTDYLNAAKSGTDAGLALARILNDKQQAAEKLALSQDSEANQNALGYATLAAKEREAAQSGAESQQMAAAKLQEAAASRDSLNQWRNEKADQSQQNIGLRGDALEALINWRNRRGDQIDTGQGMRQQTIDNKQANIEAANAAKEAAANALAMKHDLTDSQKLLLSGAIHSANQVQAVLYNVNVREGDPQYSSATNQIAKAKSVIQSLSGGASPSAATNLTLPTTSTGTSAADALAGASTSPVSLGGGVSIGSPTGGASAADALTSGTTTGALPAATPAATSGPATPQTQEELDALSSGDLYVNPADGKTYRKK